MNSFLRFSFIAAAFSLSATSLLAATLEQNTEATNTTVAETSDSSVTTTKSSDIGLFVHGGGNLGSAVWKNDAKDFNEHVHSKFGLMVGAGAEIKILNGFYFQPEFNYTQRTAQLDYSPLAKADYKFSYLEVPLLFKGKLMLNSPVQPFILAGPGFGRMVSKSGRAYTDTMSIDLSLRDEDFRKFLFTLNAGAGASFIISESVSFVAEARYTHGLTNVLSSEVSEDTNNGVYRLTSFQFLGGLQVSL